MQKLEGSQSKYNGFGLKYGLLYRMCWSYESGYVYNNNAMGLSLPIEIIFTPDIFQERTKFFKKALEFARTYFDDFYLFLRVVLTPRRREFFNKI